MNALVSRRNLLLTGVAVGAITATGAGLAILRAPAIGFRVLASGEVDIVEAIAAVMFPIGVFPVHGGDGGTAPMVDTLLSEVIDPMAVAPFRYLLRAIQIGTLVSRGRPFTALQGEEAGEVLAVWSSETPFPRRVASDSFKAILGMAFLRRPEVIRAIGWHTGCFAPPE